MESLHQWNRAARKMVRRYSKVCACHSHRGCTHGLLADLSFKCLSSAVRRREEKDLRHTTSWITRIINCWKRNDTLLLGSYSVRVSGKHRYQHLEKLQLTSWSRITKIGFAMNGKYRFMKNQYRPREPFLHFQMNLTSSSGRVYRH